MCINLSIFTLHIWQHFFKMSFYDIAGLARNCDVIIKSILYIKDCLKRDKEISGLLEDAEREVIRVHDALKNLAPLVELQGVRLFSFGRVVHDLKTIENELEILKKKLGSESNSKPLYANIRKHLKRICRFFNSPNIADAFQSIISNLKSTEAEIDNAMSVGKIDLQLAVILESLSSDANLSTNDEQRSKLLKQAQVFFSSNGAAYRIGRFMSGTSDSTSIYLLAMGKLYSDRTYVYFDLSKSYSFFRKAYELGNSGSCYYLGRQFMHGLAEPKDKNKAFLYFQEGKQRGDVLSLYMLGYCFMYGFGVQKDQNVGFRHIYKAADSGHSQATSMVGYCIERGMGATVDLVKTNFYYKKAAEAGNAVAMVNLGNSFMSGRGVKMNFKIGVKLYRLAAKLGLENGFVALGYCYEHGKGVPIDLEKSFRYYKEAMDRNCLAGMAEVGLCLVNGTGIEKNEQEGIKLIKKAAEMGDRDSCHRFGYILQYGLGIDKDIVQAIEWHQRGADAGSWWSNYSLGEIFRIGDGIEKNLDIAVKNYSIAATFYDPCAHLQLAKLFQKNLERSSYHYWFAAYLGNQEAGTTVARSMIRRSPPPCLPFRNEDIITLFRKGEEEGLRKRFRCRMDTQRSDKDNHKDISAWNMITENESSDDGEYISEDTFGSENEISSDEEKIDENISYVVNGPSPHPQVQRSFWSHKFVVRALVLYFCITIVYFIFRLGGYFTLRKYLEDRNLQMD